MYKYADQRSSFSMKWLLFSSWIVAGLCGCAFPASGQLPGASQPEASGQAQVVDRVIVKFRGDPDPESAQFLGRLSEGLGATLRYLRPLAGGAHLLQVEGLRDAAHSAGLIAELNRRAEVEYAEADALMRHQ
jgi:hypothetical protein